MMNVSSVSTYAVNNHESLPLKIPEITMEIPGNYLRTLSDFSKFVLQAGSYLPDDEVQFKQDYKEEGCGVKVAKSNISLTKNQVSAFKAIQLFFKYQSVKTGKPKESENAFCPVYFDKLDDRPEIMDKESEAGKISKLDLVPNELFDLIFSYAAKDWQAVGRISLTCKRFYRVAAGNFFLKDFFKRIPQAFDEVKNPNFSHNLLDHTHFHPTRLLPRQTSLTDQGLAVIAEQGSRLENLTLQGGLFTPQGLASLLKACSKLKTLEFHHCASPSFDEYIAVVSLYAPQVENLKIIDCPITDQSLLSLALAKHQLRSFECWDSSGKGALTDYGFYPFLNCSSRLESFKLTGFPTVSQLSLLLLEISISPSNLTKKSEQIKELAFSYCGICNEELFDTIAVSFTQLEILELGFSPSNCRGERPELANRQAGLEGIAQACQNLHTIKVIDCTYLTTETIEAIFESLPGLKHVELYRSNPLTNSFLSKLAALPQLRVLKYEPLKSDKGSSHFPLFIDNQMAFQKLETLSLVGCSPSQEGLISYLKKTAYLEQADKPLSKLRQLQLFHHEPFSNDLLQALGDYCPQLEVLEMEALVKDLESQELVMGSKYCIDDTGIRSLAKGCPSLKTLHLKSPAPFWQFTEQALQHLAGSCMGLDHLTLSSMKASQKDISSTLTAFTRRCIHLTHLGLPFCQLTDDQLSLLISRYASQLISLDLKGRIDFFKLDKTQIQTLACLHLQQLEINVSQLKSETVLNLQKHLPHLNVIRTTNKPSHSSNPYPFSLLVNSAVQKLQKK